MCDPATLALMSTAATVVGGVGSVASSVGQANAAKKQAAEVNKWQMQQKRNREEAQARQEELRRNAELSRQAGTEELSGENRNRQQDEEEARLTQYLQDPGANAEPGAPVAAADEALAGQNTSTTGEGFKSDLAAAINTATQGARARMKALAGLSSYGTSANSVGRQNAQSLEKAGADIDMFNEFRRGELEVLAAKQAVDPVQVTYTPSPLADAFSTALSAGAQGLGNVIGGNTGYKSTFKAPAKDPWAGLRQTTIL